MTQELYKPESYKRAQASEIDNVCNGCGSKGLGGWLVPDTLYGLSVTEACNIHDWMRAYIFVTKTPYYGISDKSGNIQIKNIPQDNYKLNIWHTRIKNYSESKVIKTAIRDKQANHFNKSIDLKPNIKIRRAPKAKRRKY